MRSLSTTIISVSPVSDSESEYWTNGAMLEFGQRVAGGAVSVARTRQWCTLTSLCLTVPVLSEGLTGTVSL